MNPPGLPPELSDLLGHLGRRGIPVGPLEVARLRHLLGVEGALCHADLEGLLSALLCKDDGQRTRFRRAYRDWVEDYEHGHDAAQAPQVPDGQSAAAAPGVPSPLVLGDAPPTGAGTAARARRGLANLRARLRPYRRQALGVLAALALGFGVWCLYPTPVPITLPGLGPQSLGQTAPALTGVPCPQDLPADPVPEVWAWVPVADLRPWILAGSGVLLLVLTLAAARRLFRAKRRYLAGLDPNPGGDAAPGQGLPPSPIRGDLILDPAGRREMVWSIDRYLSEDPARDLDPEATVTATARAGGEPRLVERRLTFPREVWLWCDRKTADPDLQDRLVAEVRTALTQANLPVRIARFHGLPDRLIWEDNREPFAPGCTEGAGAQAAVAILTDGAALARAWEAQGERPAVQRLLRELRAWPRLCLVDLGAAADLLRLAPGWRLQARPGDGLAAWLAGRPAEQGGRAAPDPAQLDLWAAAWLIGGTRAGHDTAQALRLALGPAGGLRLRPLDYPDLLGRLAQCAEDPALADRLVDRLARSQDLDRQGLPLGRGPFTAALDFWGQRIEDGMGRLPDGDTEGRARLEIEQARLRLWRDPQGAAADLSRLARGRNARLIRGALARLAPPEAPRPQAAADTTGCRPTWGWDRLPSATRFLLLRQGLAGHAAGAWTPRPAGRHHLALALLAGAALGGLVLGARQLLAPETGGDADFQDPRFTERIIQAHSPDGAWLGSPWSLTRLPALGPLHTPYTWDWRSAPNPQPLGPEAGVLIAGTQAFPLGRCGPVAPGQTWPRRSLAAIAAPPGDSDARRLAIRLLDRGAADRVLLAADWGRRLADLDQGLRGPEDQLLVLLPPGAPPPEAGYEQGFGRAAEVRGDWGDLAKALDFRDPRSVAAAWSPNRSGAQTRVLAGAPLVRGGPETWTDPKTGVAWVLVCGGTFLMGSGEPRERELDEYLKDYDSVGQSPKETRDKLKGWLAWEGPRHPVLVDNFWMAATELTRGQYRALGKDADGDAALPKADLHFKDARNACADLDPPPALSGEEQGAKPSLPTEAQWEYAVRAGTATRWSFGDDPAALGDHAWFRGNAKDGARPVGQRPASGLCLADLHGNLWEWVADCFAEDAYGQRRGPLTLDPKEDAADCASRVVRGGSFFFPPGRLRSAVRVDVRPDDRGGFLGLRCVRSRARQP